MCNNNGCASSKQNIQRLLNFHLGVTVDIGSRFVEYQDLCISHQGAGKTQQLALSQRKISTALIHHKLVATRETGDKIMGADGLGSCLDVSSRLVGAGILDVLEN